MGTYTYNQTGTGIHAYVIDSGILYAHTEFGGRAVFGADYAALDPTYHPVADGSDCEVVQGLNQGHGTQVAGAVGASTYGVAKNVTLHSVRVCDCNGSCPADVVMHGIDWVTANHIKPAVANMSLQLFSTSSAVEKAVRRSIAAGVVYVVIAGNNGADSIISNRDAGNFTPSRVAQVLTVASTTITDSREATSSTGAIVDLFSPGENTPSPIRTGTIDINDFFRGTSSAAPKVAGAVAMYLETDSTACPSTVGDIIVSNATSGAVTDADPNNFGTSNRLLYVPASWPAPTYYSLSLNGTSAYVDVSNTPAGLGVPIDITGSITVEAWIKTSNTSARQVIVERYNNSACTGIADGGYSLLIRPNGNVRFQTLKNGCELDMLDTTSVNVRDGMWHHIAGIFDGSEMRIYIDGNRIATKSSTFAPGTGTSHLFIGRGADRAGFFNGMIDEARITAAAVYTGNFFTVPHRVTGIVETRGLWRFDRQSARDCADINNGFLVGGATFSTSVP
jgi:hypothetical protein